MPDLIVHDAPSLDGPRAITLPLARLVCEHGTVLWIAFGPDDIGLKTLPVTDTTHPCTCRPAIAVIYSPLP